MRIRTLTAAAVAAVLTGGCTAGSGSDGGGQDGAAESSAAPGRVVTTAPDEQLTVLADPDPVAAAAAMSRALFDEAPAVVLARVGDRAGVLLASSAAVGLGVPLLLQPAGRGGADAVAEEVARLDADTVLAVGKADGDSLGSAATGGSRDDRYDVVGVPAEVEALAEATGLDLGPAERVAADAEPAAVAALEPGRPAALEPDDAGAPAGGGAQDGAEATEPGAEGELTAPERAEPLEGTVVLATEGAESTAAVATARAAGARVVLTDVTDPRGSTDTLDAMADADTVVALGAAFADEPGLDWKVATARAGEQLPGGGQLLFPGRMLVALYGHPGTGALGVLGEQPLDAAIARAKETAAAYDALVDVPVVPTFEIIATVASSSAGSDGNYSAEAESEFLRPWVEAAGEAGLYVVLDLQPGRTDFVTQAEQYRSLLELPHVGLALDPEWRLEPDQVHLTQIGSVDIEEVNRVVAWLADLTRENALPQKLLVLHQFRLDMITGRERLDARDELAIMVHVDGQGSQGAKQGTWRTLRQDAPAHLTWGWKNFYDEDLPVLTPEQTIDQVDPRPELITYQ